MVETHYVSTPGGAGNGGENAPLTEQAKQQAQQVVQKTQQVAGQMADQAREQVKTQLATQKDRVADGVQNVAQALRLTSDQLREQHQEWLGQYADSAVELVERFSGSLKAKNIDQLMGEVESFGRRQPGLFLLGAFALGFAASRFLKSSSPGPNAPYYPGEMSANTRDTSRNYNLPAVYEPTPGGITAEATAPRERAVPGAAPQATYVPAVTDDDESEDALETVGALRERG